MNHRDLILTGIGRSGTTLTCHLLNKLPDTVALHEPMKIRKFHKFDSREKLCKSIMRYFRTSRESILNFSQAVSQHVDGDIPDNTFGEQLSEAGLRRGVDEKGLISIDKPLTDEFVLCIKHVAPFTAILEDLTSYFPCFAVIRNPLSILASWNSVDSPVRDGHHPAAERLDAKLATELNAIDDRFQRQFHLLDWHFQKYAQFLTERQVLRYERIIESRGKSLQALTRKAVSLNEALQSKNTNKLYDYDVMQILGEKLLATKGAALWDYYSRESVESLLEELKYAARRSA